MGRITRDSMRGRLRDAMIQLRRRYRAALKDDAMQGALDELWPAWSSEQGAMIYAEVLSPSTSSCLRPPSTTGGRSRS